eukprot:633546-Pyramimonas_sp.AAC.1
MPRRTTQEMQRNMIANQLDYNVVSYGASNAKRCETMQGNAMQWETRRSNVEQCAAKYRSA